MPDETFSSGIRKTVKWYLDNPNVKVFLSFTVKIAASHLKKISYSPYKQELWEIITEKHDSGMGYRKISHHLNEQGIKTPKGNLWGGNNVHSVLKRNRERLQRLETLKQESKLEYGKLELI